MSRFNNGIVRTNDKCIGCNKCISGCPVIGANVSVIKFGVHRIEVNDKKCIHCGHCLTVCSHDAREYNDDTDRFFDDLAAGKKPALAIAPSFYYAYHDKAGKILGLLRSLGAGKIYDVGFGADIATYCHLKYIDNGGKAYISKACPSVISYAECYAPELLSDFIPIQSPLICLGIYVHKYLGDSSDIAFIGPCISKKDEIESPSTGGHIKYNITYKHLMKRIEDMTLDAPEVLTELKPLGLGAIFPVTGGFGKYIRHFMPADSIVVESDGLAYRQDEIYGYCSAIHDSEVKPALMDFLGCKHGCLAGPACEGHEYDIRNMLRGSKAVYTELDSEARSEGTDYKKRREMFNKAFEMLDTNDFLYKFVDRYRQPLRIPESTYDEIFKDMHKLTPQDRTVNCHSCGYSSCRDMVTAIAYGYNCMENCVHYAKDTISRLYYTDEVTGIANKAAFLRDATELMLATPDTRYVVCAIDVNGFTALNDMYGYDAGNKVLRYLAGRGAAFCSDIGVCARLDTDHFVMLFPYTDENIDKLKKNAFFDCSNIGCDFTITLRFGFYIADDIDTTAMDKMIDLAGIAMGSNDEKSHNTFRFYDESMRLELLTEAHISMQMHDALANKEFHIYLQPQFNHSSGELVGAETLCRWIKPNGSIISPGVFIPVFEHNGFIRELDFYMWDKTFALVRKWLDSGIDPVPISTNISRVSLQNENLDTVFAELSNQYSVPRHLVHLEITESAYMQNQKRIIGIVSRLREQGFIVAMDDFGSGYSSLNTLKNMPIDILKLDMGFLRGEGDMNKGGNIVSSVIRMSQSLKLATIAEGVETAEQANFLRSVGCDVIQGYLYAKPMPCEQYEKMFDEARVCCAVKPPATMLAIDIDSFFDPASGETLMFENYTGAAVVFEYAQGVMSIIRVNNKYLNALGLDKESFENVRLEFLNSLLPESRDDLRRAIEKAIKTGKEAVCTTRRNGANGTIWIKSHIWCIAANAERYTLYAVAENVSAERNAAEELMRANERFELIMENSPAGICLFRGRAISTPIGKTVLLRPITVNRFFCEWTGYPREEILAWTEKEALGVIHPADALGFAFALSKAIDTLRLTYVYRAHKKSGEYIWVKINASAVPQDDGTLWVVANFVDYTAEKQKEKASRRLLEH